MQKRRELSHLSLVGLLALVLLLALACAKTEKAAAPAPSAPQAAPSAAPAAPTAAPAPVAPAPAAAPAPTLKLDPRTDEPGSTMPQGVLQYHHTKLPLWEKAKYGGERVGNNVYSTRSNPFQFFGGNRHIFGGNFMLIDAGTCSSLGRTDFSTCLGRRNNNLKGELVPGMVEKWDQPNPVTMIMHLRTNILWPKLPGMNRTDRTVTAEDAKWYMETQKKEGAYKDVFALVASFEVQDRFTLKLNFSEPHSTFLLVLARPGLAIVPKECYEDKDGCLNKRLLSPGPFILDEATYIPRQRSVTVRNEEFWLKGMPYLDRMAAVSITDEAAVRAAFVTGKLDHYYTFSPRERDSLIPRVPKARIQASLCSCGSAHFQMRMDKPPLNDVRVRRAISMAMDRPKAWLVANDGFNALGMPMAFDYLGLDMFVSLKTAGKYYLYNPEEAKRLMKEAGYEKGFTLPVWTFWGNRWGSADLITSLQADLKQINVVLEIKGIDSATSSNIQLSRDWEGLWFSQCYDCDAVDPDAYFALAATGNPRNHMGISDPKIDEMYLKARKELDPQKRQDVYWEFLYYMYDQMYGIHFGNPSGFEIFREWLMNAATHVYRYASVYNHGSWVMWVDPEQGYPGPQSP